MEKFFHLKENRTNVRTELLAGLTTFMTMAYIIALNPNLLTNFMDPGEGLWKAVFMATCIASAVGTITMAFYANKPFVMAPGMGLNSFFAVVVGNIAAITGTSYLVSFRAALCIILIEGILFLILSIFNIRAKIVHAIPLPIRLGISPAIGLMLLNVVTMFVGLFVIVYLNERGTKASVLGGMFVASVVYWGGEAIFLKTNPFASLQGASFVPPVKDMVELTLFKFDFGDFFSVGLFTAITLIITFCMIDMFDTIGTLVGTASRAGMVDDEGNMPKMKEALLSDAVGTVAGALSGTSTVTTFVESAAGVEAGGRTGLTALTAGLLFLGCMFIAPIAALIPPAATSAALIYVGVVMLSGLQKIDWNDISQMAPVALMLLAMPISGSIGHGIGIGMIAFTVIKVMSGKAKEVSVLTYIISLLFLVKFFLIV